MNARQARDLKGVLGVVYPQATEIQVTPEPDGAKVFLSGIRAAGDSGPGGGDVCMNVRNDSPVLRIILSGHL